MVRSHLIAAHVGITHEEEGEVLDAEILGSRQVQLDNGRPQQGHPLDGQQLVALDVTHHQPPALVLPSRIPAQAAKLVGDAMCKQSMHDFVGSLPVSMQAEI